MKKHILLIFAFNLIIGGIYSQTVTIKEHYVSNIESPKKSYIAKNNISFNFLALTRGMAIFTYERYYNDYMTFEGGVGIVYNSSKLFPDFKDPFFYSLYSEGSSTNGIDPYFSFATRIYQTDSYEFTNFYVSPRLIIHGAKVQIKQNFDDIDYRGENLGYEQLFNFELGLIVGKNYYYTKQLYQGFSGGLGLINLTKPYIHDMQYFSIFPTISDYSAVRFYLTSTISYIF